MRSVLKEKTMKIFWTFLFFISLIQLPAHSQQTDTAVNSLELSGMQGDSTGTAKGDSGKVADYDGLTLDLKTYATLLPYNFKHQALFPFYLKGKDWLKVGAYALVTGGVALANEPVKRYATNLHDNNPAVASASKFITGFGSSYAAYSVAGLFAFGAITNNEKLKNTTLLATQSCILSNLIGGGAKVLFGVQGPFYTDPITKKRGPYFHGPFYTLKKGPNGEKLKSTNYVSFPSGHTFTAFSIATVYAMEYKDRPLIPILCYSAATLVGLSRLTENRHWAMDIIPGALLGYYSAKQVVNSYHRYSRNKRGLKNSEKSLSFNLQYTNSQVVPGIVYRF